MRTFFLAALLLTTTFCQARLNLTQPATAGIASWYGKREQGKKTASGERFDRRKYTCASRTYPLGTLLIVRFPAKGTFVLVRVNDRGPWVHGRVIDLSEKAAAVLGLKKKGLGFVTVSPFHICLTKTQQEENNTQRSTIGSINKTSLLEPMFTKESISEKSLFSKNESTFSSK